VSEKVIPQNGIEAANLEAVRAMVNEGLAQVTENAAKAVREAVTEMRQSDVARLKELADAGVFGGTPALSAARIRSPYHYEYQRLKHRDPEMAEWRSPDSDHHVSEWIRAISEPHLAQNYARAMKSLDEIKKLYGRATLAEGTPDASSGLAAGTAGSLVPLPLANMIFLQRSRASVLLSRVEVLRSTAQTLRVPTSGNATMTMVAESGALTQGEPTNAATLLSKKKCAGLFRWSRESGNDAAFNVAAFFAERAGERLGAVYDEQFCTSNGTPPNITESLESATITETAEITSTVLTYTDVAALYFSVPKPYRQSPSFCFMGAGGMLALLSALRITGGNGPVLTPGGFTSRVVGDEPGAEGTIFNKPILDLPFTAATRLMCGDLRQYAALIDDELFIETSAHSRFANDEIEMKVAARFDGAVVIEDAFREQLGLATIA
jgi:HK97 family phage major capsid protein